MKENELRQFADRLGAALQETGGSLGGVVEAVREIIREMPAGYIRGWLDSWLTWHDQQDEADAYRAIANFWSGLYGAVLEMEG